MTVYMGCSDVTKFYSICGSISGTRVVGQVYVYCNRKIIVCGLPDADRQQYTDQFTTFRELSEWTIQLPRKLASITCYQQMTSLSRMIKTNGIN